MSLRNRIVAAGGGAVLAAGMLVAPAGATNIGNEGCTPGYWKTHTENWEEYEATDTVASVFPSLAGTSYGALTLEQALSLQGGPGVDGATQILLRAATASLLNAAHEGLGFPLRRDSEPGNLIATVQAKLASGSRSTILNYATYLDDLNNLGCPL